MDDDRRRYTGDEIRQILDLLGALNILELLCVEVVLDAEIRERVEASYQTAAQKPKPAQK